jgi:TP901 family phage tail tape measure protein
MNIGALTAEFVLDTSQAGRTISLFQQQMLQAVKSIDASLIAMSNAMLKVGGSATIMGSTSVASINKIIVASKMASVEMGSVATSFAAKIAAANTASAAVANANLAVGSVGNKTPIITSSKGTPTIPVTPIVTPQGTPAGGLTAISAAEISNSVAQKNAINTIATSHKVTNAIATDAINQRIAIETQTAKSTAAFNKDWNAAIVEDKRRTDQIITNRLKQSNAEVTETARRNERILKQTQLEDKQTANRIQKVENEARKRTEIFNKAHEQALRENEIRLNAHPALDALNKVSTSLAQLGQRFRTFGYLSSVVVTAPMIMAGKAAFSMAKDYEFSIQKIVGLAGVAQESVNRWSEAILKMAPQVAQTPQALADALYFIASSGIKGAEALDVLQLSAKAASSGLGETKSVADYLTSALNAYRGTGLNAAYATDVLVAAVREGKAEATGFASAMGSVIPIASQIGVSLDQVAGGMAAITLTGSTAAQAATYLKGVFNVLLKGSEDRGAGAAALKTMGTSYNELRNILRSGPNGVINLMQKLRDIQVSYGDTLAAKVFPNIRAMTGYLSIAGKNFEYNTKLMERVTSASGSLSVALAAVSNTIKFQLDSAVAKAQVSLITFGKTIAPTILNILNYLVQKLDQLTKWWGSLSEAQQRHKLTVLAVIAALGPLSLLTSALIYSISGLIKAVELLGEAWVIMSKRVVVGQMFSKIAAGFRGAVMGAEAVTGAFQGTAIAASRMAISISASIGSLLGFGVVLALILPIYKKIWDKIQEMKGRIEEMQGAINFTSPSIELANKIDKMLYKNTGTVSNPKWVSNLKNANEEQLKEAKIAIDQLISVKQEELDKLKTIGYIEIANEKEILEKRRLLEEYYGRIQDIQSGRTALYMTPKTVTEWTNKYLAEIHKIQLGINQYVKDRTYSVEVEKDLTQNTIDEYTKQSNAIQHTLDIIAQYKDAVAKDLAESERITESQTTAVNNLAEAWKNAGNLMHAASLLMAQGRSKGLSQDWWTMLVPSKKENVLKDYLGTGQLERNKQGGFNIPGYSLDNVNPSKYMPSMKGEYTETAAVMNKLGAELEYVNMKEKALGITMGKCKPLFDSARERMNAYSEALEDYLAIPLTERGDAWQKLVDDTIDGLERIQKEYDKIQARRDFMNGIRDSMTVFFTETMMNFKDFGSALQSFVKSIEHAFAKLIAENFANKLMEVLMPEGGGKIFSIIDNILGLNKAITASKAAAIPITTAAAAADAAAVPAAIALTAAKSGEAIAGATASGAKMPFPVNLIAIALGIAAVIGALALTKRSKMAEGGTVPSGFPNDTYPALLTSGETVIPNKFNPSDFTRGKIDFEPVEFVIKENQLVGILRKANTRKQLT